MTSYELPYGRSKRTLHLPDDPRVDWIEPAFVPAAADPEFAVRNALIHPVDGQPFPQDLSGKRVAIAVNDKTRPVPHAFILPPLLDSLEKAGVRREDITFYIAVGTHLPMLVEEYPRIMPQEICDHYRIVSHDCDASDGLVNLGVTTGGTPIWVNRSFTESNYKIVVGNIEPHHFAGFSGGYKTAAIGLAGRMTINANHIMLTDPGARIAEIASNPLRKDIDEIGAAIGVQFALNVILNGEKEIVSAAAGSPPAVMQAGVAISRAVCQIANPGGRYDIAVASVGGAPKDINFYQSQKAISHASLFTRNAGIVILAAECAEGIGSSSYEAFMQGVTSPAQVLQKFRKEGFRVGPHKAFQVARELMRLRIILVSQIAPDKVSQLLMTPAGSLDEAYQMACDWLSPTPAADLRIVIIPRATNTIPVS